MSSILSIEDQTYVFIGESTKIEGNISFHGSTRVAGIVKGSIEMSSDELLVIEPSGQVYGDIICKDLEVHGKVEGTINIRGNLVVQAYGEVSGDINAKNIVVHPGAILNINGHTSL